METWWKDSLWRQFGAAIDMLENTLRACPDDLWSAHVWEEQPQWATLTEFWCVAFHALFWLDLYLTGAVEGFAPPAPFTLNELDPAGLAPERRYTRAELLAYLEHCRRKCRTQLNELTETRAQQICRFTWGEAPYAELLLDNMRHVQEHAAQLNLFIGQQTGAAARWVTQTKN